MSTQGETSTATSTAGTVGELSTQNETGGTAGQTGSGTGTAGQVLPTASANSSMTASSSKSPFDSSGSKRISTSIFFLRYRWRQLTARFLFLCVCISILSINKLICILRHTGCACVTIRWDLWSFVLRAVGSPSLSLISERCSSSKRKDRYPRQGDLLLIMFNSLSFSGHEEIISTSSTSDMQKGKMKNVDDDGLERTKKKEEENSSLCVIFNCF